MGLLGVLFGCLAALSLWSVWRNDEWRWIGIALFVSYVISNVTVHYAMPTARPGIYTSTEVMIALIAFTAAHGKYRLAAILMLILNFISVACNLQLAFTLKPSWSDLYTHELRTNVTFIAENLCVIVTGVLQRGYLGVRSVADSGDDPIGNLAKETGDTQ